MRHLNHSESSTVSHLLTPTGKKDIMANETELRKALALAYTEIDKQDTIPNFNIARALEVKLEGYEYKSRAA